MRYKSTSCVIVAGLVAGLTGLPAQAQDNATSGTTPSSSATMPDNSMMMDKMTADMSAEDKQSMMSMMGTMSADEQRVMMQAMMNGKMANGMGHSMNDKQMMKAMSKGMSRSDRMMMMDTMNKMSSQDKMMMHKAMMGHNMMAGNMNGNMAGGMGNGGMMGTGMMNNNMMPMMDDAMRNYMAADAAGRSAMLDKMPLSEMVQFLTRYYKVPGMAGSMPMQSGMMNNK